MNYSTIIFYLFLVIFILLFLFFYQKENLISYNTHNITLDGLFSGLIILMGFVPQLGYISIIPGISLTLIHIPVILAAYLFSLNRATFFGFVFGLTSLIQALLNPSGLNAFFIYPWISILPRVIFAFLSGVLFKLLAKNNKLYSNSFFIGLFSFISSLLHSIFVFSFLLIFYQNQVLNLFLDGNVVVSYLGLTFLGIIIIGVIGEAILASLVVPLIAKSVKFVLHKKENLQ